MPWHHDPYHRVTVVLSGDACWPSRTAKRVSASGSKSLPAEADWDEPSDRLHRGVNVGEQPYEEITIFFLDRADALPQPGEED